MWVIALNKDTVGPRLILEVKEISKSFPGVQALDRVDMDVREGRFTPFWERMDRESRRSQNALSELIRKIPGPFSMTGRKPASHLQRNLSGRE